MALILPNVKKIFLVDEGMEMADVDGSAADLRVVVWDSDCRFWKDYFNSGNKQKPYAYMASQFFGKLITEDDEYYRTTKQIYHGCVTGDHEVLTKAGWITIESYNTTDPIAVWDKDTKNVWFEKPLDFYSNFMEVGEEIHGLEGRAFSFKGTANHKFPYTNGKTHKPYVSREVKDLHITAKIPTNGCYTGGDTEISEDLMKLIVALQADGTIESIDKAGTPTYYFQFSKQRKIDRLVGILNNLGVEYKIKSFNSSTRTSYTNIWFKGVLNTMFKRLDWYILRFSKKNLQTFATEILEWDRYKSDKVGNKTRSIRTTDYKAAQILNTILHLTGYSSIIQRKDKSHIPNNKDMYYVTVNSLAHECYKDMTHSKTKVTLEKAVKIYCPTTSTGYFLCRRNGKIYVSGNSNYGMGLDTLAKTAGISYEMAKQLQQHYFTLCPEIRLWQTRIENQIRDYGYLDTVWGRRRWFLKRNDPNILNKAVSFRPQSIVSDTLNRGWLKVVKTLPDAQVALNVHDSLVIQYPIEKAEEYRTLIPKLLEVPIPYKPEPLIIPMALKWSRTSYGEMTKVK